MAVIVISFYENVLNSLEEQSLMDMGVFTLGMKYVWNDLKSLGSMLAILSLILILLLLQNKKLN